MLTFVVLLTVVSPVLSGLAFVKHFKIEEPAENLHQNATGKPQAAPPDAPAGGAQYKLSYADYHETWENFKITHSKQYASTEEEKSRYRIFMENVKFIELHNWKYHNGHSSFYLDINHFADLSHEEYRALNGFLVNKTNYRPCPPYFPPTKDAPKSQDWRKLGYVTPVKDQKECGSCYSFATTGAVEGQWFKKTGNLISLSEQQVVDCSRSYGNKGCKGGAADYAFQYIIDTGGIEEESAYPYEEKEGQCRFDRSKAVANISSCYRVYGGERALKFAVGNIGPVGVAVDSDSPLFEFYRGGVYDNPNCSQTVVDHGVLVVGYGERSGSDIWIVKNSWNTYWGDRGYIYMSRNKDNQCGIANQASFPQV